MPRARLKHLAKWLAALLLLALPGPACIGQVSTESQLKAAFLINFMKYVEWPARSANGTICLVGRDTLGASLAPYEGRQVAGHELHIRRITGPDQAAECQVLFIPDIEEARFQAVLRWVENRPVLTVSDAEAFTGYGGAIALVRVEGRLQFDVNVEALNSAGLRPNSQMMRLARQVTGASR